MGDQALYDSWADPGESGEKLGISHFPTFHILRLASAARNSSMRRYVEPFDLSYPEWRMLSLVADFSPVSFGEATQKTMMDKGQVSRTLRALEARGLVAVDSGLDRRGAGGAAGVNSRVVVSITESGRALFDSIMPVARKHQAELVQQLSPEERRAFIAVIQKLNRFFLEEAARK